MKPTETRPVTGITTVRVSLLSALLLLFSACSPTTGYRITIENQSSQPLDEVSLQLPGKTFTLGKLQPGDKITKSLSLEQEGAINYRFKTREKCYADQLDTHVSAGQHGDRALVIGKQGAVKIIDKIRHTEVKRESPQEWALPCMIPG